MNDTEIPNYFTLCTRIPLVDVRDIEKQLTAGTNPRDVKMRLAREIVSLYHGADNAQKAEETFIETFQKRNIPEEVLELAQPYIDSLITQGVVASRSELHRLLDAGGVRNAETGEKYTEFPTNVAAETILKIGKRRFIKLVP
jgi:tyrosyl-tRNA synthetase